MLAAIDDNSENDEEEYRATLAVLPSRLKDIRDGSIIERPRNIGGLSQDGSEEEPEEDQPIAPRGRLAARMQAGPFGHGFPVSHDKVANNKSSLQRNPTGIEEDSHSDGGSIRAARRNRTRLTSRTPSTSAPHNDAFDKSPSPLFVSPGSPSPEPRHNNESTHGSDSDDDFAPPVSRLQAIVARKRKQQDERERLEAEERAERIQRSSDLGLELGSDERAEDDDDDGEESSRRLTQQSLSLIHI